MHKQITANLDTTQLHHRHECYCEVNEITRQWDRDQCCQMHKRTDAGKHTKL